MMSFKYKLIAIGGSPGVGKSEVAALLSKRLDAQLISITELVKTGKIRCAWDKKRKTKMVTVHDVRRAIGKAVAKSKGVVVAEGLLTHLIESDATFILRCNPVVLRKRLRARRWPKAKIEENVLAEMLDIITAEAVGRKTYEIDTTRKSAKQTTAMISKILASATYAKKFKPGKIKWLGPKEISL